METLRITALRHSAFYSPLLMTIAGGFLREEGLQADYQPAQAGESVPELLRRGDFHLSQSAVATSFADLEAGKQCDVVHFAQINERDGFFIAGRQPDPHFQWQKLRGRKVLVDHFFQPLAMLRYGLHKQGVALADLDVIDAGDVQAMDQAFRTGLGDFVHQQGPAPQQLEADAVGYPLAAVGDAVGPVAFSSLCATRDWLKTDMAKAFMRAYRKAKQFVIEAPAEEIAGLEKHFFPAIDEGVLTDTITRYQQLGCWTQNVNISPEAYEKLLDVFEFSGAITRRYPMSDCVVSLEVEEP